MLDLPDAAEPTPGSDRIGANVGEAAGLVSSRQDKLLPGSSAAGAERAGWRLMLLRVDRSESAPDPPATGSRIARYGSLASLAHQGRPGLAREVGVDGAPTPRGCRSRICFAPGLSCARRLGVQASRLRSSVGSSSTPATRIAFRRGRGCRCTRTRSRLASDSGTESHETDPARELSASAGAGSGCNSALRPPQGLLSRWIAGPSAMALHRCVGAHAAGRGPRTGGRRPQPPHAAAVRRARRASRAPASQRDAAHNFDTRNPETQGERSMSLETLIDRNQPGDRG